jgi:hypothetical protein
MIASTAASAGIKNGIGKSFLRVSGVSTKPGLMMERRTLCRSRSGSSASAMMLRAALLAP